MILGIDTSNYTTSLALVDTDGHLVRDIRKLLSVANGERGLRQSEALFQHLQNISDMLETALTGLERPLVKVVASVRPRNTPGSYMPVFLVSRQTGLAVAAGARVPFQEVSHQEGHLAAGLWSAGGPDGQEFLAVHLSGGTSEILRVNRVSGAWDITCLGGTADLQAGQFIDRVGVALGLPFPAGPALEQLAQAGAPGAITLPSRVQGMAFHLSGAESAAQRLIAQAVRPEDLAWAVQACLAKTLERSIRAAMKETGLRQVLLVGGVAANTYLRERLRERLEHRAVGASLYFAAPQFSTDNAVGVALLGGPICKS